MLPADTPLEAFRGPLYQSLMFLGKRVKTADFCGENPQQSCLKLNTLTIILIIYATIFKKSLYKSRIIEIFIEIGLLTKDAVSF